MKKFKYTEPEDMTDEEFLDWLTRYRKNFDGAISRQHADQLIKRLHRLMKKQND